MIPSPVHFFCLLYVVSIEVGLLLSIQSISFSIGAFLSHFPFLHFPFHSSSLSFSLFHPFFLIMLPSIPFLKSVLGNEFGKSSKDQSRKIGTDVVLYDELDDRCKLASSPRILGAGETRPDKFPFHLHCVHLYHRSGRDLIVIRAVLIQNISFPNPYLYEFHCPSIYKVP